MIVIDTSVAVKWAIAESALLDLDEARCAPDLLLPELAYVLRKKVLRAEIGNAHATAALDGVKTAIDVFVPSAEISAEAFALATRLNHSCYDCFFLATAIGGGILATADAVFARKCVEGGFGAFVFLLGEDMTPLLTAIQDTSRQPQGSQTTFNASQCLFNIYSRLFGQRRQRQIPQNYRCLQVCSRRGSIRGHTSRFNNICPR